jgi:glycosyltransferase involved in cell wall biosynthesis
MGAVGLVELVFRRMRGGERILKQPTSRKDTDVARPYPEHVDMRAVVHVVPRFPPALGGTETAVQAIAHHQHKAGIRVQVLTSDQGRSDATYEEQEFPVARLRSFNFANTPIMPSLLFRLFALSRESIIHVHIAQAYTPDLVWAYARMRRVQYVAHFHADVIPSGRAGMLLEPYKRIVLRRVIRDASKVLVPTEDYRDLVCSKYGIQRDRVAVVDNGTDHRTVEEPRSITRQGETARLLFVGRLAIQKNVPLLLRAAAAYRDKYDSNFHLTIVGDGDMRPAIEAEIRRLELGTVVSLIGVRHGAELESIYETSDLLILTSIFESFGLVLVEAMTKALPIVSVYIPAVRNVVLDGVNGLLVESEPDALADAIHTLLTDGDLYAKVSINNLAAARRYTWSSVVDKMSTVYSSL